MSRPGRNEACSCGSGKKFKHCCGSLTESVSTGPASVPELLGIALHLHKNGRLDEAGKAYEKVLSLNPAHHDALHLLGVVRRQSGDHAGAVDLIQRAISVKPDSPHPYNSLGMVFVAIGDFQNALESYEACLALSPHNAEAHNNLGNLHRSAGNLDLALQHFNAALRTQPGMFEAHTNVAIALLWRGDHAGALQHISEALALNPDSAEIHNIAGNAYKAAGDEERALHHYNETLMRDPSNGNALHFSRILRGESSSAPPAEYVSQIFDEYAASFDSHLQQALKYDAPRRIAEQMASLGLLREQKHRILDLGCGTGLMGAELKPFASTLVGIDLSANMLRKAEARAIYTQLVHGDLKSSLTSLPAQSYDVVVAMDVFIYVGALDQVLNEIKRVLAPGGIFAFTVESADENAAPSSQAFTLRDSGRYAHGVKQLSQFAGDEGFSILWSETSDLRTENGKAIPGWLTIWQLG